MSRTPPTNRGSFEREWRRRFERFASGATAEHQISGWSETGLRRRVHAFELLLGERESGPRSRALDLGSGPGFYVRLLAERGYRTVGTDYSLSILKRAVAFDRERAGRYVTADAYALPFADGSFDLVTMIGIFQAISDPISALREVRRVLKPGGELISEFLNAEAAFARARTLIERIRRAPRGVRPYRRGEMERCLRASGLSPMAHIPIFLPPRRYPGLERALDHPVPRWVLIHGPGLTRAAAAAFLIRSVKPVPPECAEPREAR